MAGNMLPGGLAEDVARCVRCGGCQAACPLYPLAEHEAASPRGRVQVAAALLEGSLPATPRLAAYLDYCLTCRACEGACSSGVRVERLVLAARAVLAERLGLGLHRFALLRVLGSPPLLHGLAAAGRVPGLLAGTLPLGGGRPALPLPRRSSFLRHSAGREFPPAAQAPLGGRAAFFAGCLINHLYPATAEASLRALRAAGFTVVVPAGQGCCGLPALVAGDRPGAARLARRQLDALGEGWDFLVTACASCGAAFRHHYPDLLGGDPVYGPRAARLAERTRDVSELLAGLRFFPPVDPAGGILRVTYHDPCHLARGQGVRNAPRALLRALPGVELVEMQGADNCCGGAGSFCFTHPAPAAAVGRKKAQAITATGARAVVTGCPACQIQLTASLRREGLPLPVLHTVDLVAGT